MIRKMNKPKNLLLLLPNNKNKITKNLKTMTSNKLNKKKKKRNVVIVFQKNHNKLMINKM